jgi:hypothetical protein
MSAIAVPWLPPPRKGEAEAAIAKVLAPWSAAWFAQAVRLTVVPAAPAPTSPAGWHGDGDARAAAEACDTVALGLTACAGRADPANPADRQVLEAIGAEMLADLAMRLGEASAGEGARFEHGFAVEPECGGWRMALALGAGALTRARKAAAGSGRRPLVAPLAAALADEDVGLGCHLGEARVTAAEIAALAVGDLLVLDRGLDAPLPLTVAGAVPRTGLARIAAADGTIRVTVAEPPDLSRKT